MIPDAAKAEIFIRLVDDGNATRKAVHAAVGRPRRSVESAVHSGCSAGQRSMGFETTVVSYTTDIPAFGGAWGKPFLLRSGHHSCRAHDGRARPETATC